MRNSFNTGFDYFPTNFRWEDQQLWGWFGSYYDTLEFNGTGELNYPIIKFDAEINQY